MAWWNPIAAVVSSVSDAVSGVFIASEETKQIRAQTKVAVVEAKGKLAVAKINADVAIENNRATMAGKMEDNLQDYDMQVLKNRDKTLMDEVLVAGIVGLLFAHFLPFTQEYMRPGWEAMGYPDGPAWWFEFAIVVAIVSTLGGMRVLTKFFSGALSNVRRGDK